MMRVYEIVNDYYLNVFFKNKTVKKNSKIVNGCFIVILYKNTQ